MNSMSVILTLLITATIHARADINTPGSSTPFKTTDIAALFSEASQNRLFRMCNPEGLCAGRQIVLWDWLERKGVASGTIGLGCPTDNIVVTDQFSGKTFRYSGYHLAPVIRVNKADPSTWMVFDVQFLERPVPIDEYLKRSIRGAYEELKPGEHMPIDPAEPCRWLIFDEDRTAADARWNTDAIKNSQIEIEASNKQYCP